MKQRWSKRSVAICGIAAVVASAGVFSISASCGGSQARTPAAAAPQVVPKPERVRGRKVSGVWAWNHQSESDGVRRIEQERWQLVVKGRRVMGSYRRTVTFLAIDGAPFACNQDLRYSLATQYQVEGTLGSKHVDLREVSFQPVASPCERGVRRLSSYRAIVSGGQLLLRWTGGSQTLTRVAGEEPDPTVATRANVKRAPAARGAWQWRNRTETRYRHEVRVEAEDWQLAEDGDGGVSGTYLRTVTVFNEQGSVFACNGATYYQYRDRYTVRGTREGDTLQLREVAVAADQHVCLAPRKTRHLDAATGTLFQRHLVLNWRGRKQVLRRPSPPIHQPNQGPDRPALPAAATRQR